MNTVTVRQAVLADLEVIADLFNEYRQFQGKATDLSACRAFLHDRFNHGESTVLAISLSASPSCIPAFPPLRSHGSSSSTIYSFPTLGGAVGLAPRCSRQLKTTRGPSGLVA